MFWLIRPFGTMWCAAAFSRLSIYENASNVIPPCTRFSLTLSRSPETRYGSIRSKVVSMQSSSPLDLYLLCALLYKARVISNKMNSIATIFLLSGYLYVYGGGWVEGVNLLHVHEHNSTLWLFSAIARTHRPKLNTASEEQEQQRLCSVVVTTTAIVIRSKEKKHTHQQHTNTTHGVLQLKGLWTIRFTFGKTFIHI